jgi:hypothetical protein
LAWQISFELTQRDENEGPAAEHNSGESYCDRYVHPHLLDQDFPFPVTIVQSDIGNAKTKS